MVKNGEMIKANPLKKGDAKLQGLNPTDKPASYRRQGGFFMPYLSFKEIWTPLSLFRIRFFKCLDNEKIFIKIGNASRRPIF
jgi:hypothetical protein